MDLTTSEAAPKAKGMCIATRCTTVDQFVEMFHRFVDEDSFFVSTVNTRPPGLETSFSVQLADGTPVLRGLCVVLQAWTTAASPFKTPGVRLGIKRLTANSMPVFERLLVTRSKPVAPPRPPPPSPALAAGSAIPKLAPPELSGPQFSETGPTNVAVRPEPPPAAVDKVDPPKSEAEHAAEQRTPGSDLVLPANPLMNLTDASLEGYVDCTLYEETGTFFPVDDEGKPLDELVPPPAPPPILAPRPVARLSTPVEIVADEPPSGAGGEPAPEPTFEPPVRTRDSAPVIAARGSAPAIATRDSAPMIPARDSSPAIVSGEIAPPADRRDSNPAFPAREITPAGEIGRPPLAPPRRTHWYVIGGVLSVAAAAAIWFGPLSSSDAKPDTPTPAANEIKDSVVPATGSADVPDTATNTAADKPTDPAHIDIPEPATPEPEDDSPAADPPDGTAPLAGDGPCRVTVTSTPAGSIVSLDGKSMAPSPVTLATSCERHKIDIRHPRYQAASKFVVLAPDKPKTVDMTLQRPTHSVSITSQPSGATVFINGKRAGTTPTKVSVLGFSFMKLELKKTGYAPIATKIYSKVPQDKFTMKLTKW